MNRGLVAIPLDQLVSAVWNYKGESEHMMNALIDNMKRNGQIINLIVREMPDGRFEVVNGNHRLEALQKNGESHAACFNLGKVSQEEAVRTAIETNETNFRSNIAKLSKTVTEVVEAPEYNMETTVLPYETEEVHRFKEMQAIDWDQKPKPPRTGSAADKKANMTPEQLKAKDKKALEEKSKQGPLYTCPGCGHQFDKE